MENSGKGKSFKTAFPRGSSPSSTRYEQPTTTQPYVLTRTDLPRGSPEQSLLRSYGGNSSSSYSSCSSCRSSSSCSTSGSSNSSRSSSPCSSRTSGGISSLPRDSSNPNSNSSSRSSSRRNSTLSSFTEYHSIPSRTSSTSSPSSIAGEINREVKDGWSSSKSVPSSPRHVHRNKTQTKGRYPCPPQRQDLSRTSSEQSLLRSNRDISSSSCSSRGSGSRISSISSPSFAYKSVSQQLSPASSLSSISTPSTSDISSRSRCSSISSPSFAYKSVSQQLSPASSLSSISTPSTSDINRDMKDGWSSSIALSSLVRWACKPSSKKSSSKSSSGSSPVRISSSRASHIMGQENPTQPSSSSSSVVSSSSSSSSYSSKISDLDVKYHYMRKENKKLREKLHTARKAEKFLQTKLEVVKAAVKREIGTELAEKFSRM